ncbi:hypothetical protein TKK_0005954 [Trichogramma kaykai]
MIKDLVDYILEDASENYQDDHGYSYLHGACMTGNVAAALRFMSQGADVALDTYDYSPLHIAVQYKNTEIVEILLKHGANPNHRDCDQSTPLHRLVQVQRYLCDCDYSCLSCADKKPADEIVAMLMESGANIEARDCFGDTPLQAAVSRFNVDLTRLLLQHGATLSSLSERTMFNRHFSRAEIKNYPLTSNIIKVVQLLQSAGYKLDLYSRLDMIRCWIGARENSKLDDESTVNFLIRPHLELLAADLFMTDYCTLHLPYVACRKVAEHMSDEDLFRLYKNTEEDNLRSLPRP